MKVDLAVQHPRFGRGDLPEHFITQMREHISSWPDELEGIELRVELDNSLAMASNARRRGQRATIVVDWAQVERALLFAELIWSRLGQTGAAEALVDDFEAEILLCASRKALVTGNHVYARELHRILVERRGRSQSSSAPAARSMASAVQFASFIIHHEIGHQLCRDDETLAATAFADFQQGYRKLLRFTPLRAEELFCDRYAILALREGMSPGGISALTTDISLLLLHLELWSVTSLSFHMLPSNPNALAREVAHQVVGDRVYRSEQALDLLTPSRAETSSAALNWRNVCQALYQAAETALENGINYINPLYWGEADHLRACMDELLYGITPEAEAAIFAQVSSCE